MEKMAFHSDMKVGEIVSQFPHASNVFKQYKIDFCCGGGISLATAAEQKQIDIHEVLSKLEAAYAERSAIDEVDWRKASSTEIIRQITAKHHAYLTQELPILSEFLTKVLRVHGPDHPELKQLHRLFHMVKLELQQHLIKEEEQVFPLIEKYEQHPSSERYADIAARIRELEAEHSHAGELLGQMRSVSSDYRLPDGACRTYTVTYRKLEELENDMFAHVHLENNILFTRFE